MSRITESEIADIVAGESLRLRRSEYPLEHLASDILGHVSGPSAVLKATHGARPSGRRRHQITANSPIQSALGGGIRVPGLF
jgi:hypothetical protein